MAALYLQENRAVIVEVKSLIVLFTIHIIYPKDRYARNLGRTCTKIPWPGP